MNVWPFCRPGGAQSAPALSNNTIVYLGYPDGKEGTEAILDGFFVNLGLCIHVFTIHEKKL